jgi:hypothetical protein
MKEIENRKRKEEKKKKIYKRGPGNPFGPAKESAHSPPRIISRTGISFVSLSL